VTRIKTFLYPAEAVGSRFTLDRLQALCAQLDLTLSQQEVSGEEMFLSFHNDRLCIKSHSKTEIGPVYADFDSGKSIQRMKTSSVKEPLARALGFGSIFKKGDRPKVWDATAGLGRDLQSLLAYGCLVTATERDPFLALLLEDAIERSQHARVKDSLTLFKESAETHLARGFAYDVIYFDPMYPAKENSAMPKKEIQVIKRLEGALNSTEMDENLLMSFSKAALHRVVVKRPLEAKPLTLAGKLPTSSFESKLVRFDWYKILDSKT
jgi:16S rRNA (guanine1516-N2)-methyltransferase